MQVLINDVVVASYTNEPDNGGSNIDQDIEPIEFADDGSNISSVAFECKESFKIRVAREGSFSSSGSSVRFGALRWMEVE
jgi:hypothetical protein